MKNRLRYIFGAALVVAVIGTAPAAMAHDGEDHSNDNSSSASTRTVAEKKETAAEFKGRLDKLKTKYKVNLQAAEKQSLKTKCKPAQSLVAKLNTKFGNSVTTRTKAYEKLEQRLDKLVEKLKVKEVNTATLEQQITELKAKITTYKTDLDAYKQSLTDLKDVDCAADPDAFQAALEASRAAHQKLTDDVKAIRTYLVDTIKPTLQTIKQQLEDEAKASEDDSADSSNEGSN